MSQPVPNIEPGDVDRLLSRDFGAEADTARAALGALSGNHPGAVARVSAAVLRLADGDLERLRSAVATALGDWRDVIAAAEYPRYMGLPEGADATARAAAIEADGSSYQVWLAGGTPAQ
ncbi:MAG: hypothetical protein AAGA37_08380 [Actinomycetota bacterium]